MERQTGGQTASSFSFRVRNRRPQNGAKRLQGVQKTTKTNKNVEFEGTKSKKEEKKKQGPQRGRARTLQKKEEERRESKEKKLFEK